MGSLRSGGEAKRCLIRAIYGQTMLHVRNPHIRYSSLRYQKRQTGAVPSNAQTNCFQLPFVAIQGCTVTEARQALVLNIREALQ